MSQSYDFSDLDYSPDSFSNAAPPKRSNTGRNTLLLLVGGCGGLIILTCCCCIGAGLYITRLPAAGVFGWGQWTRPDGWDFAKNYTCSGSQAEQLTEDYDARGVTLDAFSPEITDLGSLSKNEIVANATLREGTNSEDWEATFITKQESNNSGLSHCIDEIRVTRGG